LTGPGIGICPYARAFVNDVCAEAAADAVVVTTVCDQMRRASELIGRSCNLPVFLMHVPSTWQTVGAHELYMSELERLGRFLVRLEGSAPSPDEVADVMRDYGARRWALRSARDTISPRRYAEAIVRFHEDGTVDLADSGSEYLPGGVPLALVGGPLMRHHLALFDLVESAGGQVVLDGTSTGERTIAAPFDRRELADAPLLTLADAYFGSIPDAFRRPNSDLYQWLKREMTERAVHGVILWRYVWCDTWHAEVERMREWVPVPVLAIDADEQPIDRQTASRIQSFVEVQR
jgi:benzoyl-CoA reductase/2-hydroxyglutaryl-CoA dehydratase subunit BcrC/BadD/HgdB